MRKLRTWLRRAAALAVLTLAALLCWQCIDIYGGAERSAGPAFTAQTVGERLTALAVPGLLCAAVLGAAAAVERCAPAGDAEASVQGRLRKPGALRGQSAGGVAVRRTVLSVGAIRAVLYGLALTLIVLGVMNGGLWDVLVKAINICTECIGLG